MCTMWEFQNCSHLRFWFGKAKGQWLASPSNLTPDGGETAGDCADGAHAPGAAADNGTDEGRQALSWGYRDPAADNAAWTPIKGEMG